MNIFHYRDIESVIHKQHPLGKIFITLLISSLIIKSSLLFTTICFIFLTLICVIIKIPFKNYAKEGRYFFFLIIIIGASDYLNNYSVVGTTRVTLAFISMLLLSIILIDTTAFNDIASAIGSLFSRLSKRRGYSIASTIELTLSMIPLFFDLSHQLLQARKARGQRFFSSPFKTLKEFVESFFSMTLIKVEHLEMALKARAFNPQRERDYNKMGKSDITTLIAVSSLIILLYLLL